ncbi:MAG: MFS transporter [bacterium]
MKHWRFLVHSFAHFVNDGYGGFLAPLLPILAEKHHLSLSLVSLLVTVQTLTASLSQPAWGYLSDRFPSRLFIIMGVLFAGIFSSLIGTVESFAILVLCILLGGLGTACFHPMATSLAAAYTKENKGLAIALFITAGTAGYSFGPVFISFLVSELGLKNMYWAVLPALAAGALWLVGGPYSKIRAASKPVSVFPPEEPSKVPWNPIYVLVGISVIRAYVLLTFTNFIPFYLKDLGFSLKTRGVFLFALLFGDAIGSLIGGKFSDRLGRWKIIFWTPLFSLPFLYLFLFSPNLFSLSFVFLAGVFLFASAPAVVVGAQAMMVKRESLASALQIGFAWGIAGLLISPTGKLAEHLGIYQTLLIAAAFPILMSLLALLLFQKRTLFEATAAHH